MWERRLEAEGAPEGLAFFPFLWREPRAFRGGETQCNCTLKKKKKEAAGRFGGESWEFKVNSESFLFFFFKLFFFFFEGGEILRKDIGVHFSPQSVAFAGILGKS